MGRLVYGVGINDANYNVSERQVVDGKLKDVWRCPYYQVWKDMLCRCYNERQKARRPTYAGCKVDAEWLRFSNFKKWMERQDWKGNHLDKDILVPGNKTYSAQHCVFVTRNLNSFLCDCGASRGDHPLGVCLRKDTGTYQAVCSNPFSKKNEYIGLFPDPESAHEAWRCRKHELACKYAETVSDPRVSAALRSRYAPETTSIGE